MYCVIVGDIVNSRGLDAETREKVTRAAQNVFDRINAEHTGSLMTTFGMVRGDAFEGVLLTQYHAPRIIQDIIKAIYHVDKTVVRISVAMGQLSVTSDDRNVADGPAFHMAFDNLDKMKARKSTHWLQVSFEIGDLVRSLVDGHIALLTALTEGWTDRQHEVVWAMERHGERKQVVGKAMGITASVIDKQLKAANYHAYRKAWKGLTDYLVSMDEYTTEDKSVVEKSYVPYFNMGERKSSQRNFKEALPLYLKALQLAKEELGEKDPQLTPILDGAAETYCFLGKYDQAEILINEALELHKDLPKARMQYTNTLVRMAQVFIGKKRHDDAIHFLNNALEIVRSIKGENHASIGYVLNGIAVAYAEQGNIVRH